MSLSTKRSPSRTLHPALAALVALAAIGALAAGCRAKAPAERARVAVSIFPIYDLVRRVAGPDAEVTLVLPPGTSPLGFQPGPRDAAAASAARLGVMVGLGLDAWMETLMPSVAPPAAPRKPRMLKVGDRVPTLARKDDRARAGSGAPDEEAAMDPYVWLDPQRARLMVKAIGEDLAKADPPHAGAYRQRTSEVDAALDALDKEIDARTAPLRDRAVASPHPTFGYLAERYHLTIAGAGAGEAGAVAAAPLAAESLVEALGGTPDTDSYEKLIRFDIAALERAPK